MITVPSRLVILCKGAATETEESTQWLYKLRLQNLFWACGCF